MMYQINMSYNYIVILLYLILLLYIMYSNYVSIIVVDNTKYITYLQLYLY